MVTRTQNDKAEDDFGNGKNVEEPADFETAIFHTGFGKFNYLLMLFAMPATWSGVFDTTTMSYILPSAGCDLELSNLNKGVLNSIVYAGNISSAFLWGFLSDTYGRRRLLLIGYFLLSALSVASSFSQIFWTLTVLKYFGGFVSCGPFAILLTYLAEFTGSQYRARIIMLGAIYQALGLTIIPAVAWILIPQAWSWTLFGGYIVFNSWRLFLVACALPSFISGCCILFFHESPKFLMSQSRRVEALIVFRRVYSLNTGNHPDTYPVKCLIEEKVQSTGTSVSASGVLTHSLDQVRKFFHKPYISRIALVFTIQFCGLWGLNTIRLWLPQLLATMEEYFIINVSVNKSTHLCDLLVSLPETIVNETLSSVDEACVPVGGKMYIYSIIVGAVATILNLIAGVALSFMCKKKMLKIGYFLSGCCVVAMYWSNNMEILLALSSLFVGSGQMCAIALMSVVVDLFPTSLRSMALSLVMMIGRLGGLTGNLIFPVFMEISCSLIFFLMGAITLVSCVTVFLLPKTTGKALE